MNIPEPALLKSKKGKSSQQIQLHIGCIYDDIRSMINEKQSLDIELPAEVPTAIERLNLIKSAVEYVLEESQTKTNKSFKNSITESIECKDCQCYEKQLQKVQAEVRNHIRTHQQLKLYQDSLEEKIEEGQNEKKQLEKKVESLKKKMDETKAIMMEMKEKNYKLQLEIEKAKNSKKINKFQTNKENVSELSHRNHNKFRDRVSIEKRTESTQKMRLSVNMRSAKGIPLTSKLYSEKTKEDKAKILKNRLGF